jgi:hypothetical protein
VIYLPAKQTIIPLDDDGVDIIEEATNGLFVGRILRFRDGNYYEDKEKIFRTDGKIFAFQAQRRYWQRWEDGKPVNDDLRITLNGQKHPLRETLGYDDESQWPAGLSGKPEDPWHDCGAMHILDEDTGQSYSFATNSYGGRLALTDLASSIRSYRAKRPGAKPLIALAQRSWKTQYGMRQRPDFPIQGWAEAPLTEAPY